MGRTEALEAFAERGLVWVQGQGELSSLADLLAGHPVTTKGYSWDYVPAWELREELSQEDDVQVVKLVRGRSTLVHARHWPAVQALAVASRRLVVAGDRGGEPQALLAHIERTPGRAGADLKTTLGLAGKDATRRFGKLKTLLETWLAVVGAEQEDLESHTHDALWYPWREGKIAQSSPAPMPVDDAIATLLQAIGVSATGRALPTLLPVARGLKAKS